MAKKRDIAIAYRIYPLVSKTPPVYSSDKAKLAEFCLASFREALGDLTFKIFAILDSCPPDYKNLFLKYFDEKDLEFIETTKAGNQTTFLKQIELLTSQTVSDCVYFAEDDYFYLPNALEKTFRFVKSSAEADFATPYDHPDYYSMKPHIDFSAQTIERDGIRWRTVATTTLTFLAKKRALLETKDLFKLYARSNSDASLWLAATKHKILNPLVAPKYVFRDRLWLKIFVKTWLFSPSKIFSIKKKKLYAPEPSLATHMDDKFLAPKIDWKNIFKNFEKVSFVP